MASKLTVIVGSANDAGLHAQVAQMPDEELARPLSARINRLIELGSAGKDAFALNTVDSSPGHVVSVCVGSTPVAALWGAYTLVERVLGVRFLLHHLAKHSLVVICRPPVRATVKIMKRL